MPSSVALPTRISGGASLPTCTPDNVVLASDTSTVHHTTSSHILLSTALVKVVSEGKKVDARILLDNGSTANFITSSFCDRLRLPRRSASSTVTGINSQSSTSTQSCNLVIESNNGDYKAEIDCFILPQITKPLPLSVIDTTKIQIPSNIHLADPSFHIPSAIDILVGAEIFWSVIGHASIDLGKNQPKFYDTKLGWIVSGPVVALQSRPSSSKLSHFCNFSTIESNFHLCLLSQSKSYSSNFSSQEERALKHRKAPPSTRWTYTPSMSNPADHFSRGLQADLISECSMCSRPDTRIQKCPRIT
ncbi:uncharacterized protein LOC135076951 [Ostrinia nubilalis]|uniref:uncharacterized protein LOC135076951 n=1 Tax=Ostrinia nubilalis TaxID=29057 RepID=UPI0030822747